MTNVATIFLDGQGVIKRKRPDYLKSWSEFEFLPKIKDAIGCLEKPGGVSSS